jgi:hypothetical protein
MSKKQHQYGVDFKLDAVDCIWNEKMRVPLLGTHTSCAVISGLGLRGKKKPATQILYRGFERERRQ